MASMTLRGVKTAGKLKPIFNLRSLSTTRVVSGVKPWYYLYKPDPYPQTDKEREIAAKKYGMILKDYTPISEGENFGDYPDLPIVYKCQRLYDDFDMPALKRNYGEPVYKFDELYSADRIDEDPESAMYPKWKYWACFLSVVIGGAFLEYTLPQLVNISPHAMKPKQYPFEQVAVTYPEDNFPVGRHSYKCLDRSKHYTFDTAS